MAEGKRTVVCIYPGGVKKTLPIKEGVIEEAKGKCLIEGGRPPFEEPAPVTTKSTAVSTTKANDLEDKIYKK